MNISSRQEENGEGSDRSLQKTWDASAYVASQPKPVQLMEKREIVDTPQIVQQTNLCKSLYSFLLYARIQIFHIVHN